MGVFGRIYVGGCIGNSEPKLREILNKINELSPEERAKYDELNKKYIIENLRGNIEKPKVKRK